MRRKKKLAKIALIFSLILVLIFTRSIFHYLSGYLAKSEHVNANILVVEGWLPDDALEKACIEFKNNGYERIVTTGLNEPNPYSPIYANGFVIFHLKKDSAGFNEKKLHTFQIDCFSELGGDNRAHFNFYINDSLVTGFLAERMKRKFIVEWEGNLSTVDSMMIQYDNDRWGELGDRNLFLKEIVIDQNITYPSLSSPTFIVTDINGKTVLRNYFSNASAARHQLIACGIDSSLITAVSGERVHVNRTLTSALAFRDWTRTTDTKITGINVLTLGAHSRRTWMIYSKLLHEKYSIGIISVPDRLLNSRKYKLYKTVRESLGIVYYWFILLVY